MRWERGCPGTQTWIVATAAAAQLGTRDDGNSTNLLGTSALERYVSKDHTWELALSLGRSRVLDEDRGMSRDKEKGVQTARA